MRPYPFVLCLFLLFSSQAFAASNCPVNLKDYGAKFAAYNFFDTRTPDRNTDPAWPAQVTLEKVDVSEACLREYLAGTFRIFSTCEGQAFTEQQTAGFRSGFMVNDGYHHAARFTHHNMASGNSPNTFTSYMVGGRKDELDPPGKKIEQGSGTLELAPSEEPTVYKINYHSTTDEDWDGVVSLVRVEESGEYVLRFQYTGDIALSGLFCSAGDLLYTIYARTPET